MKNVTGIMASALCTAAGCLAMMPEAGACTRVLYKGIESLNIVGRSLDWKTPIPTNLYVYPRGIEKLGYNEPNSVTWRSRYGGVYAVGYDGGITEGMNEKGLVINGLFCKGTVYNNSETENQPKIALSMFVGWLLDMNATTREVVAMLRREPFSIVGATFDGGVVSSLHWGVTDATGESVIIEFDHGKLNIYDMAEYYSMANDPDWRDMTAIIDYWENVGGKNMLPGRVASADRCVRGNYFAHHVESVSDAEKGVMIARSILHNVCVPYTYQIEGEPNLSSTQWCSYANTRDLRYYFEIVTNLGMYYIDLTKLDLHEGSQILKLDTSTAESKLLVGDATARLQPYIAFTPMF